MKIYRLIINIALLLIPLSLFSQGYNIDLSISGYSQKTAYLGYYWGAGKVLIDTATTNEKYLNFTDKSQLTGGMYFIQLANNETFNFVADGKQQNFLIKTKLSALQAKMKISKSTENKMYAKYLKTDAKLKKKYADNSYSYDTEIRNFATKTSTENPNTFFSQYLKILYNSKSQDDYFSSFDFSDARILKTIVYHSKVKHYLDTYARNGHQKIISETKMIIEKSQANKDVFKYTTEYIFSRYDKPTDISTKKVYLSLAKTYYLSKKADWTEQVRLETISNNVDNYQYDIAVHHNTIELYEEYLKDFPNGNHKQEAIKAIEELKFGIAKNTHTVASYELYLKEYPEGKYANQSKTAIEDLKFQAAKNSNTISAFNKYLSEYPKGRYKTKALNYIEDLKYEKAVSRNTISGFNSFLSEYPNSRYLKKVKEHIETIKFNDAKRINTEAAYNNYLAEYPNAIFRTEAKEGINKLYEKQRRIELLSASKLGLTALEEFAAKYPETNEAEIALNSVNRYKIENNALEKKVYIAEKFFWVAEGNRDWLNDFYEGSRNSFSGGKRFNIFAFATVQNKTNDFIKLKVQINLNLIKTSNLSIFYNVSNITEKEYYYLELGPKEQQSLLVLYKDISEGVSFGKALGDYSLGGSLLSAGSETQINSKKPIDVILNEYTGEISSETYARQNKLISEVRKNKGNIKVNNKSQKQVMDEWLDGWLGTNTADQAYLTVYFSKKNSGDEVLKIYNQSGELVKEDTYSTTGSKNESYGLPANQTYTVHVPGYSIYSVYVRKRITHLIIESDGTSKINHEDEE